MHRNDKAETRQQRSEQLQGMWADGKRGQATVLSLCHRALPEGESLQAGMSIFNVILDHEFGPPAEEEPTYQRQIA